MARESGSDVVWREKEEVRTIENNYLNNNNYKRRSSLTRHNATPSQTYFFKLSAYADKLLAHYAANPSFILPASRRNEVVSFVKSGLTDLSISRSSFTWGVPVPKDPDHVMYVWVDALTNYLTGQGYPATVPQPADVHIVGKDILRFHAVYWPAFLMSAGLDLPGTVFAHGWWTRDGQKISKSLGNVISPFDLTAAYGADAVRFFLASEVAFGSDGDFSHGQMVRKCNAVLANGYGNLNQRVCSMVYKNFDGAVPKPEGLTEEDESLLRVGYGLVEGTKGDMGDYR